jgi:ferredoxin
LKEPVVDKDICQGHTVCVGIAPQVFEIDSNGKSSVKDPEGADTETIQRAIDACPVEAISWKET